MALFLMSRLCDPFCIDVIKSSHCILGVNRIQGKGSRDTTGRVAGKVKFFLLKFSSEI